MATALERKESFVERLSECGVMLGRDYTLAPVQDATDSEAEYNIEVIVPYKNSGEQFHLFCHAIMGMIAHFSNRKWAKGWTYMYIMKGSHGIIFTNESD